MAAPPLLSLRDIRLGFGGRPLFEGVELNVLAGDRLCLVGRNGSGKSTLLKVAAGLVAADSGERFEQPGAIVRYLAQEPDLPEGMTVRDWVAEGLSEVEAAESHKADILLDELALDGQALLSTLSGGQGRRAAIAQALVGNPDVLLLDEPTNHLDLSIIQWLEERLARHRGGLVVISHDKAFLSRLTNGTLWLDRGLVRRGPTGFSGFEVWAEQVMEEEARDRHKLNRLIISETKWLREGISARRKRNMGRVRRLQDLRTARAEAVKQLGTAKIQAEAGDASGKLVIEAKNISKAYTADKPIVKDFSTRVLRGDRIGVVGGNGAGKTTLIRMLTGDLKPDQGQVKLGANLTPVYIDQRRSTLDSEATPWTVLSPGGGEYIEVQGARRHVAGYLKDFLFEDRQFRSPAHSLSGGERNRLLLARELCRPANLMVLDEPTNDLDMDTLDLLADVLGEYEGTLLLVSHDRDFLDQLVNVTLVMEPDGQISEYAGGYSDALAQRGAPLVLPAGQVAGKSKAGKDVSEKPSSAVESAASPSGRQAKLSYKEKRALEILPGKIAALEADIVKLEALLAPADAYAKDPEAFTKNSQKLESLKADLASAEEEWLEVEMKREELGV